MIVSSNTSDMSSQIVEKAKSLGASLAGIASVDLLKRSPSHYIYSRIEQNKGVGSRELAEGINPGEIAWPASAKSAVVIALAHKKDELELDWWENRVVSAGGRIMARVVDALAEWVEGKFNLTPCKIPYHVEEGGIFYKDAAVMAGLGCMGKNNLVVTPEFGPRVRITTFLLNEEIMPTGPTIFDPCDGCDEPCRKICHQEAFNGTVYSPIELGMITLPGRDGWFNRALCNTQVEKDIENGEIREVSGNNEPVKFIKYCRRCDLACPVGK